MRSIVNYVRGRSVFFALRPLILSPLMWPAKLALLRAKDLSARDPSTRPSGSLRVSPPNRKTPWGLNYVAELGKALSFLGGIFRHILRGHIRFGEVLKQMYEQGVQSIVIIALASLASGAVFAIQGAAMMTRFGAKEYIAQLVAWSLVREMSPVFAAIIFSAKAGARITAELGTMNVNDQMLATRALGVDPVEYLVVPRMVACFLVLPILTIISEVIGIFGGYLIGVYEANIPSAFYINQTFKAIQYVDFFSGLIKVFFFSVLISWICCFQGFFTSGGSLGVGKFTTKAVAYSIILVILSNTVLTKLILMFWG